MDCQQSWERTLGGVAGVDEGLIETFWCLVYKGCNLRGRKLVAEVVLGKASLFPAIRASVWGSLRYPHTVRSVLVV